MPLARARVSSASGARGAAWMAQGSASAPAPARVLFRILRRDQGGIRSIPQMVWRTRRSTWSCPGNRTCRRSRISRAASARPVIAARYSEVARLMRRTPACVSSATENDLPRMPTMKFTGLLERRAHRAHRREVRQAGREQHVGAGALVGLQASDRVVEIGAAVQIVLGARSEREREGQRARGFRRGGDALGGQTRSRRSRLPCVPSRLRWSRRRGRHSRRARSPWPWPRARRRILFRDPPRRAASWRRR